jgi:hypothetical protein
MVITPFGHFWSFLEVVIAIFGSDPLLLSIKSLPVVSEAHSPCKLAISVFTWIPGVTISSLKMLPIECLASAGRFLGKMRSILDNLSADSLTASRRYHQVCPLRSRHQRIHHPCCPENLWCCFEPLLTFFRH